MLLGRAGPTIYHDGRESVKKEAATLGLPLLVLGWVH